MGKKSHPVANVETELFLVLALGKYSAMNVYMNAKPINALNAQLPSYGNETYI